MTKTQLIVGKRTNAGFGDFYPVSVIVDGKEYGCDVHIGTGSHDETPDAEPTKEIINWQDGNGLLFRSDLDLVSEADVWKAVESQHKAKKVTEKNWINGQDCGSGYDVYLYIDSETDAAAALIRRVYLGGQEVYVNLSGLSDDEAEQICQNYANGGDVPAESEDGAESLWDELHAAFCGK